MNRSLYYPLGRAADMDAGGAADLQTDIMRFMAILSLCLVAIFALVQSISLEPSEAITRPSPLPPPKPINAEPTPIEVPTPPAPAPEKGSDPFSASEMGSDPFSQPEATKAQPQVKEITWRDLIPKSTPAAEQNPNESTQAPVTPPAPPPEPAARELAEAPVPPTTPPAPAPSPEKGSDPISEMGSDPFSETTTTAPEQEGFTLRFESDTALTRLVARNEIGLYAITDDKSLRMSVNRGTYSFWPASAPNQYHEMDPATVPADVITALRRSGSLGLDPAVKWGVTLPSKTQGQLNNYLTEYTGGSLVIEGDGNLRLEP